MIVVFCKSQEIDMVAKSFSEGKVSVIVSNKLNKYQTVHIDTSEINFACNRDEVDGYNPMRINLCVKNKRTLIPELLTIIQGKQQYGKDYKQNLSDYIFSSTIILKPLEKKEIIFDIYKQRNYKFSKNYKVFVLNSKLILYQFNIVGDSILLKKRVESNRFSMKLKLMK